MLGKRQLLFWLDPSRLWQIVFSKNGCNEISHSMLFFQCDFDILPMDRWDLDSLLISLSGPVIMAGVTPCDFWAKSYEVVQCCLVLWGHSLLEVSCHVVRKPRPHGEATFGCISQQPRVPSWQPASTSRHVSKDTPRWLQAQLSSHPSLQVFPGEAPDIMKQWQTTPAMSGLNSGPTESPSIIKWLFCTTKPWGGLLCSSSDYSSS